MKNSCIIEVLSSNYSLAKKPQQNTFPCCGHVVPTIVPNVFDSTIMRIWQLKTITIQLKNNTPDWLLWACFESRTAYIIILLYFRFFPVTLLYATYLTSMTDVKRVSLRVASQYALTRSYDPSEGMSPHW